jgi:hypothetical protein
VKEIINCPQEIFTKRDKRAGSQPFSYYLIIALGPKDLPQKTNF